MPYRKSVLLSWTFLQFVISVLSLQYCHSVGQNTWKHAVLLLMQQFGCPDFYFTFLKNNKIFHNLVLYRILDAS